jgi:hypothetical protein
MLQGVQQKAEPARNIYKPAYSYITAWRRMRSHALLYSVLIRRLAVRHRADDVRNCTLTDDFICATVHSSLFTRRTLSKWYLMDITKNILLL